MEKIVNKKRVLKYGVWEDEKTHGLSISTFEIPTADHLAYYMSLTIENLFNEGFLIEKKNRDKALTEFTNLIKHYYEKESEEEPNETK